MSTEQLTDTFERPLRDLRISVTDRCNFRCPYCMPADVFHEKFQFMQKQKLLTFEEITRLTGIIVQQGAVKLRLTGGEPLVRQDVDVLVKMLSLLDGVEDMAMTTNAFLLPKFARKLFDAGLQRLTISLDSLDNDVFRMMNGDRADVGDVLVGIQAAKEVGFTNIKINSVVQRGVNDHTLVDMARWARDEGYTLRFIEYMDVGTMNGWKMDEVVPAKEIVERIGEVFPLQRSRRNHQSDTALRFEYVDGAGEIGVIASVTMPFCGHCSRMRLSPEGKIYTCLFATEGTDLKTPLRDGATDEEIAKIIQSTWKNRTDRYSEERTTGMHPRDKIEMYYIGG